MIPRNNFEIVGLDEIINDLNRFGVDYEEEIQPFVDKAGDVLLDKTREKVPVDSGTLKESLFLKRLKRRRAYQNVLTWGDDVRAYAAPLELGHGLVYMGHPTLKYIKAKPYLRPAADESKEIVYKTIFAGLIKEFDKLRK